MAVDKLMTKSEMTEADIRDLYITPAIEKKWDKFQQIKREYYFTDGQVIVRGNTVARGKRKFADYLLYYKPNLPIAIVEAKDNNHNVGDGMQQAIEYALALDVPFVYSSNGDAFLEHDMKKGTEREISMDDFPSPEDLWKRYKEDNNITKEQEQVITIPYHFETGSKTPRYYQRVAINRTIEAISKGQKRILLVMATGTGKTYTAFQIVHRLWKSGYKKVLYLADRNILIDQTMGQDFRPFEKVMTKVESKKLDSSYEIFFALYHQLAGDENDEPFRQFTPDYFDIVVVDECHRGSAKDDSRWRKILEYFDNAIQIGMTATPKETKEVSNITYFGDPVYTYSLKQGIDDGFLAPYKVRRVNIDVDLEGWRPYKDQKDLNDELIEDREYNVKDFDKNLIIDERTQLVAHRVSELLKKENDRFAKTIFFCVDIEHAERMRQALVNENSDLVAENPKYVMRITGDNQEGKNQLDYFIDAESKYPVLVTTSMLMTTGVDCKTVKYIVIDKNIESTSEFKQIIGRGTRLQERYGKMFFTIIDFRNVSRIFADPEFDGKPVVSEEYNKDGELISVDAGYTFEDENTKQEVHEPEYLYGKDDSSQLSGKRVKYHVNNVNVQVLSERVQYYDKDGKLITESLTDYTKKNILGEYASLDEFLKAWTVYGKKAAIIDELKDKGVLLEELRNISGNNDMDDFDLICHLAYDAKPLTKQERINNVKKTDYLNRYQGLARDVLDALLEKYMNDGIDQLEDPAVLTLDPFREIGSPTKIASLFGGREGYINAVQGLVSQIYQQVGA